MPAALSVQHSDGSGVVLIRPGDVRFDYPDDEIAIASRDLPLSDDPATSYILGLEGQRVGTARCVPGLKPWLDSWFKQVGQVGVAASEIIENGHIIFYSLASDNPAETGQRAWPLVSLEVPSAVYEAVRGLIA